MSPLSSLTFQASKATRADFIATTAPEPKPRKDRKLNTVVDPLKPEGSHNDQVIEELSEGLIRVKLPR